MDVRLVAEASSKRGVEHCAQHWGLANYRRSHRSRSCTTVTSAPRTYDAGEGCEPNACTGPRRVSNSSADHRVGQRHVRNVASHCTQLASYMRCESRAKLLSCSGPLTELQLIGRACSTACTKLTGMLHSRYCLFWIVDLLTSDLNRVMRT